MAENERPQAHRRASIQQFLRRLFARRSVWRVLLLTIPAMLPLFAPASWREMFRRVAELTDGQIRFFGLAAVLLGLLLLAALY